MRKLSVMEMEHVQGGRELDCAIAGATMVLTTAFGILTFGGGAIAIAALSVAYLKNIYNTGRACDLF
ncbi:MAG TPA: hypothetical protein VIK80_09125 [Flavihumibacter sp.]|jgi:hypothetical protein